MAISTRLGRKVLFSMLATCVICVTPALGFGQDAIKLTLTIDSRAVRFSTPTADVLEWRLEVSDQQDRSVFNSDVVAGTGLTWALVDAQGQDVDSGMYSYTLSIRGAGAQRTRQGQLLIQKTGTGYQIWAVSDHQAALATNGETAMTVNGSMDTPPDTKAGVTSSETSIGSLPTSLGTVRFAGTGYISGTGTTGYVTKWADGPGGVVGDTQMSEFAGSLTIGNGSFIGGLHIFGGEGNDVFAGMGPNLVTGPAFNYGYAGGTFGRSAGFFNVRPDGSATPPNPSLRFMTANIQRMIITNAGDVAVGIGAPEIARLQVVNANGTDGTIRVGSAAIPGLTSHRIISFGDGTFFTYVGEESQDDVLVLGGAGGVEVKSAVFIPFTDNYTYLGTGTNRWQFVYAANGTIQTSDARLKQRIHTLSYGLNDLLKLRPVSFEWKDQSADSRRHLGLLAQDVEQVIPEIVHREAEPDAPLGMNYSDLVPVLIKAVQEQHAMVERAAAELDAMKTENASLRARLEAIESLLSKASAASAPKMDVKKRRP